MLPAGFEVRFVPLDASWVGEVEALEARVMGSDAWNAAQIIDDLPRSDRTWVGGVPYVRCRKTNRRTWKRYTHRLCGRMDR